jgi:hypothetical protein
MRRSIVAMLGAVALVAGAALYGQAHAQKSGVNIGSLTCNVAGGVGYVFGSSKDMSCLFNRTDGVAERYAGTINKYGVDIGFTKEAQMVWLVFAPGTLQPGALSGGYAGATATAAAGVGVGANVLIGGNARQITLQPVSVEGSVGLNVAAGVGEIQLKYAPR